MRSTVLGLLVVGVFAAASAAAQSPPLAHPDRGLVRQSCQGDIQSFCAGVQAGGGRVGQCLRENRQKLSPGCKEALIKAHRDRQAARQAGAAPETSPPPR